MGSVPATEFKAKCLELMDRVAQRRESFVITKRGKPVAKLVPVERRPKEPLFGRLRDLVEEVGDITGPLVSPQAWRTLQEWEDLNAPRPSRASKRARKSKSRRKKHR